MNKREFTPEEIAKSLRVCATFGNRCKACIYELRPDVVQCYLDLRKIAADMIDAQAKRIGELEAELAKLREEKRWISVEERLPENDQNVLVIVSGRIGNIHLDRATELAEFNMDEGWILEMWPEWENPIVTHWKPMPKGPEVGHE